MRIAHILYEFPDRCTFILDQITGLIDRGHDIFIFADTRKPHEPIHPDVAKYGLERFTHLFPSMPAHPGAAIAKGIGLAVQNAPRMPVKMLRSLNVLKYGRHAYSLRLLYAAASLPRVQDYDIIHCHFGPYGLKGSLLRDIGLLRGKLVTSFYGYDVTQYPGAHGAVVYRRLLFDRGDLFLPLSRHMRSQLLALGCPPDRAVVHHLGVDCERFSFLPRTMAPGGKLRLLSIANHVEKKGLAYAIEAVTRLHEQHPDLEYHIIGEGPLRQQLEKQIGTSDAGGYIKLRGWLPRPEVVEALMQAHMLLAPSVVSSTGDEEGTPVAIMEAMASGLPVVSTRHSGIPELVRDGVTGYLVPEKDAEALTESLRRLLENPSLWPALGQAGRDHVKQHFNIDLLNDDLVRKYERLLHPT